MFLDAVLFRALPQAPYWEYGPNRWQKKDKAQQEVEKLVHFAGYLFLAVFWNKFVNLLIHKNKDQFALTYPFWWVKRVHFLTL